MPSSPGWIRNGDGGPVSLERLVHQIYRIVPKQVQLLNPTETSLAVTGRGQPWSNPHALPRAYLQVALIGVR